MAARFPNKLLVIGVVFILIGGVLLLWTNGSLIQFISLWPIVPIVIGLSLIYLRWFRGAADYYVAIGVSLLLIGVVILLDNTVLGVTLKELWPLVMTVGGCALLIYGLTKRGYTRLSLSVPGGAMIVLSALFLPFSLGLIERSFADVVKVWWPVIFLIVGVALLIVHLAAPRERRRK